MLRFYERNDCFTAQSVGLSQSCAPPDSPFVHWHSLEVGRFHHRSAPHHFGLHRHDQQPEALGLHSLPLSVALKHHLPAHIPPGLL